MTSLVTANGSLLKRTMRGGDLTSTGGIQGAFRPLWSSDDQTDEDGAGQVLASFESIYRTQPLVAAAVDKMTRQGSTLPLKVYRRQSNGERERIESNHPLERLLRRPQERKGPVHLKQWALMPMLVHGNALIAKFREDPDGPPSHLLPVDWGFVEAYAQEGGPVEMWATMQTGERRYIDAQDVLHFAWESPSSEIGVSPLEKLGTTVRIENAAQRHHIASFKNGVRPSSAVTVPEDSNMRDPEVRKFYRAQLEAMHKGVDQSGKMALLSPGADIKVLSFSAADAQLMQQRYVDWEEIQAVYDLAGPLVGDLRHGTYSNVEELNKQLYKSVLRPWLTLIEEVIQAQLIDPEPGWDGLFVEFDLSEVLKGDPVELATALKMAVESGQLTPNEARRVQNRPRDESEGADKLYLPQNNLQPIDAPVMPEEPPRRVIQVERDDQGNATRYTEG